MKHFDAIFFTDLTDTTLVYKPLGAFKVAHVLRQHGYRCLVIDHFHMWSIAELMDMLPDVVTAQTKFVGFSTTFFKAIQECDPYDITKPQSFDLFDPTHTFCPQGRQFEDKLVTTIRSINPNVKIMVGGHKASPTTQDRNIDYVMTGHSEQTILDFMDHLTANSPLNHTYKNLWGINVIQSKEITGPEFAHGGMRWLPEDVVNARVLPLESARGCIFNCKFCSFPMRGTKDLEYVLAPDLMYQEMMENWQHYGITTYSLMDDTFNDNDDKIAQILSVTERLPFQPKFWCYARLDLLALRPERIHKMKQVGVRAMVLGIETLNTETGRIVGKGMEAERQIETIRTLRQEYGNHILMHGLFIVGLPRESAEHIKSISDRLISQDIPLHSWTFKPLDIRLYAHYKSEFEKNWLQYGYHDDGEKLGYLQWRNEYFTWEQAWRLSETLNREAAASDMVYVNNQTAWGLLNYPEFDLDSLANTKRHDLDWNHISRCKINYVNEYKNLLVQWLAKNQQ